jgi:predicted esterase
MRCERHGLAAGPDGTCVLCRRELAPVTEQPRSRVGILLLLLAVVLAAGVALVRRQPPSSSSDLPDVEAAPVTRVGPAALPGDGPPPTVPRTDLSPSDPRAGAAPAARAGFTGRLTTRNSAGRSGAYYLPSGYEAGPRPLLVAIHGTGGDGGGMIALFREAAERGTFLVLAPDSRRSPGGQFTWQVGDHPGDMTEDLEHIGRCLDELRAMPGVQIDLARVLIAGHSGGASEAPYVASSREPYSAFAVLHGGVFATGLGPRHVRGWFSTGDADPIRPPAGVQRAAEDARKTGFGDIVYREFHEGHDVGPEEVSALVTWWLGG